MAVQGFRSHRFGSHRGDGKRRRGVWGTVAAAGMAAVLGGAALLVASPTAGAAGNISITQTAIAPLTGCTTPEQALSFTTESDASRFELNIRASSALCEPITATAAIYAMPKDGAIWPQSLVETKSFTIGRAGVTSIVFARTCTPAQFDVVVGATPQVIAPWGERHGPLLIPDLRTAHQDPGVVCQPVAPTPAAGATTVPASRATTAAPTTTVPAVIASASTPTTSPPRVLDVSSDNPDRTVPQALAVTGVSSQHLLRVGLTLLVGGVGMMLVARRNLAPNVRMVTSRASVNPTSPFSVD